MIDLTKLGKPTDPEDSSGSPMCDAYEAANVQGRGRDGAVASIIADKESLKGQPTSSRHAG